MGSARSLNDDEELREDEVRYQDRDGDGDDGARRRQANAFGAARRAQAEVTADDRDNAPNDRPRRDPGGEIGDPRRLERRDDEDRWGDVELNRADEDRSGDTECARAASTSAREAASVMQVPS